MYHLEKKFNLGLNLDADISELDKFFSQNRDLISSVYFSLPLGAAYYSRTKLREEYAENQDQLLNALNIIRANGIKLEVTFNTELNAAELEQGIEYILKNNIDPEEIVCMNSSVQVLKKAFPKAKLISSFCNGYDNVEDGFHAIVLGQQYLRDESKRREWVDKGYEVILLLNNGCSFECMHKKCNSRVCSALYENSRKQYDEEEIYAIQSFFPTELKVLLERDRASDNYIFKISNRPLGLEYTKKVLDAYSTLAQYTETDFDNNPKKYALFGALTELCRRIDKYHYPRIMEIKRSLMKDM